MKLIEKITKIRDEAAFVKDQKVQFKNVSYDAWTEAGVMKVLRPLFKKHKVHPVREGCHVYYSDAKYSKVIVTMRMYDLDSDETLEFSGMGTGFDTVDKDAGKASTYAVKDAYLKLFAAVSGLDPDMKSSDEVDQDVRAEAVDLLNKLAGKKYFSGKAQTTLGLEVSEQTIDAIEKEAKRLYNIREAEIKEESITKVSNMVQIMKEILKTL